MEVKSGDRKWCQTVEILSKQWEIVEILLYFIIRDGYQWCVGKQSQHRHTIQKDPQEFKEEETSELRKGPCRQYREESV